jgi:hypothetical protein
MKITTYKTIDLLETLYELQHLECEELGIESPMPGTRGKLPDGREMIYRRLWDQVRQDQHGNQEFGNDRFYIVTFEGEVCIENGDDPDMIKLYHHCKDALNDFGCGMEMLLFYICW